MQAQYPLTGGVKPTEAAFPTELNPEVRRLQEENAKLQSTIHDQAAELRALQALMEEKDRQISRYFSLLEALVGVKHGNGGNTNLHA